MSAMERLSTRTVAFISALGVSLLTIGPASAASAQEPSWSPAVDVATLELSQYSPNPQLAVSGAGRTVAVWSGYDGQDFSIQTKWSDDAGLTWSPSYDLSDRGSYATPPNLTVDPTGRVIAVWTLSYGTTYFVQSNSSDDGGATWSMPVDVTEGTTFIGDTAVAFDSSGNAIAVWSEDLGSGYTIRSSRSTDDGASWSSPVNVSASAYAASPQIATDPAGNAIVVWNQNDGVNDIIRASNSTDGGVTWASPTSISASGQTSYGQQLTVDASGRAIAVWYGTDGSKFVVRSSSSDDAGATWSSAKELSSSSGDSFNPIVKFISPGRAVSSWSSAEGSDVIVETRWSDDGGVTWQAPIAAATAPGEVYGIRYASDSRGNMMLVWHRSDGVSSNIAQYTVSIDGGLTWSDATDLSGAPVSISYMSVSVDSLDRGTLMWSGFLGDSYVLQSRTLSSPSNPALPNTGISSGIVGSVAITGLLGIGLGALLLVDRSRRRRS
jgi:hypothetical protein